MTQKINNFFKDEFYSKPPKRIIPQTKTDVYHIDDIWSLDLLDL